LLQKNTIDELLTLLLEAKILVSGHPIYRTNAGILVEKRKVVLKQDVFRNTEKTETCHGNAPQILFGTRTTTVKSLKKVGFVFLLHKLLFIVSRID